jgi:Tol biopolymer transport system component
MRAGIGPLAAVALGVIATATAAPALAQGTIERVSVGPNGAEADGDSFNPVISVDGRFVAFHSSASNLVPSDTNSAPDVFVRDRRRGVTSRASVRTGGAQVDDASFDSAISADGRFIAFWSFATNLVAGDRNGLTDVFVHDRQMGVTRRVSVGRGGAEGDGDSSGASISADGRFVAFCSTASNLVPGDLIGRGDIFVRDRRSGVTHLVTIGASGAPSNDLSCAPSISANGRFVAFQSFASNLVPGDTNGLMDVFVRDRDLRLTRRVSVRSLGGQASDQSGRPDISADGRFVAFDSAASDLVPNDTNDDGDVFVRDRRMGVTRRVSVGPDGGQADGTSFIADITTDGRFVAFLSVATNLVPGDTNGITDVFVRDRSTSVTRRVSGRQGALPDIVDKPVSLSADGRFVVFTSVADSLVPGDTNGLLDVFVRDRRLTAAPAAVD